jgi:hypothetical protein
MTTTISTRRPTAARHSWVPAVGALSGATFVLVCALVLGFHNDFPDGPLVVMYDLAILTGVAAGIGLGLRRTALWARIVVAVAAPLLVLAWIVGLGEIVEPLVAVFSDQQYVQDEVPPGLLGVVLLAASYVGIRRDQSRAGAAS